jgi:hypothetical protein
MASSLPRILNPKGDVECLARHTTMKIYSESAAHATRVCFMILHHAPWGAGPCHHQTIPPAGKAPGYTGWLVLQPGRHTLPMLCLPLTLNHLFEHTQCT